MPQTNADRASLANLSLPMRSLFTGYILVVGIRLLIAGAKVLLTHGMADGKFGISQLTRGLPGLTAEPRQSFAGTGLDVSTDFHYWNTFRRKLAGNFYHDQLAGLLAAQKTFGLRDPCVIESSSVVHCEAFSATSAPPTSL